MGFHGVDGVLKIGGAWLGGWRHRFSQIEFMTKDRPLDYFLRSD